MSREPHFVLNVNGGVDTIHDPRHLSELCNTDQIEGRERVDVLTAAAMLDRGDAVRCQHCTTEGDPS